MTPPMLDGPTLLAIAGMALAAFATRAGGWWLFRRVRPTPLVRAVLHHLPGCLFVAYVVPAVLAGGAGAAAGAAAAVAAMLATRTLAAAIAAGVAAAWAVWALG